jgi:Ran GTPase-activating protein (RanGAP) involved in mRNA processing and transport
LDVYINSVLHTREWHWRHWRESALPPLFLRVQRVRNVSTMELLERLAANDPQLTLLNDVPLSVGMRELAAALALNTTLTYLRLSGRGLVAADAHELAGALERNRTLTVLSLSRNNIGSDGARYLAAALERNSTLNALSLYRNNVGSDGARDLAAALERNKTLTELYLTTNNIGDDGARHLAAALERNVTLRELYLFSNNIGEAGAAALWAALETNCTLAALDGVDGVDDILKRNRGFRVARKQQVTSQFFIIAWLIFLHSAFALLWFCLG